MSLSLHQWQWQFCLLVIIVTIVGKAPIVTASGLKVPATELGFVYNPCASCQPPITWNVFCDNTCPDCKQAFPNILEVADHFGPNKIKLIFHLFSLPFHRHSISIATGANVIHSFSNNNNSVTYNWFKHIYDNIDQLTNSATENMTELEVLHTLAEMAKKVSGISQDEFLIQLKGWPMTWKAWHDFEYSCTRGVFRTPTFMVNDVLVLEADQSWTIEKWTNYFNDLL